MSIEPASFLVMPRLVAMALLAPLLTLVTDVVGVLGGCLVSATRLRISPETYMKHVRRLALDDAHRSSTCRRTSTPDCAKAFVFGVIIATVGCAAGLRASGGAIGVGRATRTAVIQSFLLVIVIGYYLTSFFYT